MKSNVSVFMLVINLDHTDICIGSALIHMRTFRGVGTSLDKN